MAASEDALSALHAAVATYFKAQLEAKTESGQPMALSAAEVGNILRFLKDNNITCVPGGNGELDELLAALGKNPSKLEPAGKDELSLALEGIGGGMRGLN